MVKIPYYSRVHLIEHFKIGSDRVNNYNWIKQRKYSKNIYKYNFIKSLNWSGWLESIYLFK